MALPRIAINGFGRIGRTIMRIAKQRQHYDVVAVNDLASPEQLAYKHLNAAAVMVNDHTVFRVDWMPFVGLKQSG